MVYLVLFLFDDFESLDVSLSSDFVLFDLISSLILFFKLDFFFASFCFSASSSMSETFKDPVCSSIALSTSSMLFPSDKASLTSLTPATIGLSSIVVFVSLSSSNASLTFWSAILLSLALTSPDKTFAFVSFLASLLILLIGIFAYNAGAPLEYLHIMQELRLFHQPLFG